MFALSSLVDDAGKIPFWTLFMVYVIQSVGELCLSPIGLSMVTKLAPVRLVGFGMGGWFLSTGIGNNLSGIFAGARQRRDGHDHGLGAARLHLRLLGAGGSRRAAVPDRAADQQADARREVTGSLDRAAALLRLRLELPASSSRSSSRNSSARSSSAMSPSNWRSNASAIGATSS